MRPSSGHHRRDRILDAAEAAFAERGFEGASLRRIVQAAKVNLATVYYYFGSKTGLAEAVLKRRFGPLREEQLERLRQGQEAAKGQPLSLKCVLEAMLRPPLRLAATAPARREVVARLIGRIVTEPNPHTQETLRRQRIEVRTALFQALEQCLPHLSPPTLRWRFEFVWGALAFILCNPRKLEKETQGACDPADIETVLSEMMAFFEAGFRAPAAKPALKPRTSRRKRPTRSSKTL